MHSFFLVLSFTIVLLLTSGFASARTWTDVKGRSIEGEWVKSTATQITIRLDSGKTVSFPLSRLSEADQKVAAEYAARKKNSTSVAHPAGWKRLTIILPEPDDEVYAVAMPGAFHRIGVRTWTAVLPLRSWVRVHTQRESYTFSNYLFEYQGKPQIHLKTEQNRLLRSFSGRRDWSVVCVNIAHPQIRQYKEDRKKFVKDIVALGEVDCVCLSTEKPDHELIAKLNPIAITIQTGQRTNFTPLQKLPRFRGLSMTSQLHDTESLGKLTKLECLDFSQRGSISTRSGSINHFRNLTNLRYLDGLTRAKAGDEKHLVPLRKLEGFVIRGHQFENHEYLLSFKNLHSLTALSPASTPSPKVVGKLRGLVRLKVAFDKKKHKSLKPLHALKNITALGYAPKAEDLNAWRKAGGLVHLQELGPWNGNVDELKGFSNLRHLSLISYQVKEFREVTKLRTLDLSYAKPDVIAKTVAAQKQLRYLRLHVCTKLQDLTSIGDLSELRVLELRKATALASLSGIEKAPKLERLLIEDAKELADTSDLEQLSALEQLSISRCAKLSSLSIGQLRQLKDLKVAVCPLFSTLTGLSKATNLVNINFASTEAFGSIAGAEALENLETVQFYNLPKLTSLAPLENLKKLLFVRYMSCRNVKPGTSEILRRKLPNANVVGSP